jgi:hypothetical protein
LVFPQKIADSARCCAQGETYRRGWGANGLFQIKFAARGACSFVLEDQFEPEFGTKDRHAKKLCNKI